MTMSGTKTFLFFSAFFSPINLEIRHYFLERERERERDYLAFTHNNKKKSRTLANALIPVFIKNKPEKIIFSGIFSCRFAEFRNYVSTDLH